MMRRLPLSSKLLAPTSSPGNNLMADTDTADKTAAKTAAPKSNAGAKPWREKLINDIEHVAELPGVPDCKALLSFIKKKIPADYKKPGSAKHVYAVDDKVMLTETKAKEYAFLGPKATSVFTVVAVERFTLRIQHAAKGEPPVTIMVARDEIKPAS